VVCYICQIAGEDVGASFECHWCHHWICAHHESAVTSICERCHTAEERRRGVAREDKERKLREARWCDFCGRTAEDGWSTPHRCAKCKRQFCMHHGQVVWDESEKSASGWVRCIDHLAFPNKFGDASRGFNIEMLFIALSLPLMYVGLGGVFLWLTLKRPDYYRTRGYGERWSTFRFLGYDFFGDPRLEPAYEASEW